MRGYLIDLVAWLRIFVLIADFNIGNLHGVFVSLPVAQQEGIADLPAQYRCNMAHILTRDGDGWAGNQLRVYKKTWWPRHKTPEK